MKNAILMLFSFFLICCSTSFASEKIDSVRIFYLNNADVLCSILQDGTGNICYGVQVNSSFSFSPSGEYAAFRSEKGILLLNTKTHRKSTLVSDNLEKYELEWSPDSKSIVYTGEFEKKNGRNDVSEWRVDFVNVSNGKVRTLIEQGVKSYTRAYWSKDGSQIYYIRYRDDKSNALQLTKVNIKTGKKITLKEANEIYFDLKCGEVHFNQANNDDSLTKPVDYNPVTNMTVYEERGEIYLKDLNANQLIKIVAHQDYNFKENEGYFNPRWINKRLIIFVGRETLSGFSMLSHLLYQLTGKKFFLNEEAIFIYDIETQKKRELAKGGNPGWFLEKLMFERKAMIPEKEGGFCGYSR